VADSVLRRYRLHPQAAYLRDLGYVFIEFQGRMFRMPEPEFTAFRAQCAEGLRPGEAQTFRDLLMECASAQEANESFQSQEILPNET